MCHEILALDDIINPALVEHIRKIRENRMASISEITVCLNGLREIRKFFFESDYQEELSRLKEFVGLCKELAKLKESGILDAVSDISIRLAIKEESTNERK